MSLWSVIAGRLFFSREGSRLGEAELARLKEIALADDEAEIKPVQEKPAPRINGLARARG